MSCTCNSTLNLTEQIMNTIYDQCKQQGIPVKFSDTNANLTENDISFKDARFRIDFKDDNVFTIDCEDCKDMDDAVSIIRTENGYRLGIYIADVSSFIQPGSELDKEATSRGTSFYFPTLTIPMLPQVLSNNLCSLNPGKERFVLSFMINLDTKGHVLSYEINKGIIRSRVKGIYSEVNAILGGYADAGTLEKYHAVLEDIYIMEELYQKLRAIRIQKGADVSDNNLPKIIVSNNRIDLEPHYDGIAENLIEEFMILANQIVSQYMYEHQLPMIFRSQDQKNHLAKYISQKGGHASLALDTYTHVTPPIRRLTDLKLHQILSMYLDGVNTATIHNLFDPDLEDICNQATRKARTAKSVEKHCRKMCYAYFFDANYNKRFTGKIIGCNRNHQSIILIPDYSVTVLSSEATGRIGTQFEMNISVDSCTNTLYAYKSRRIAA